MIRRAGFVLALALAVAALFMRPSGASAATNYLERRVTSISTSDLMAKEPLQLVDPRRQQVAREHGAFRRAIFLVGVLLPGLALLYLWRSGWAARLRDGLARRLHNRVATRFWFGACVATIAVLAAIPAELASYRLAVAYQLTPQPIGVWLRDGLAVWLLGAVLVGAVAAGIYTLVARTRLWYVYAALGLFALAFCASLVEPVALAPVFEGAQSGASAQAIASSVRALELKAGAGDPPIYVARGSRSAIATARLEGWGPTQRIVLTRTLVHEATPGEIAFVTAREIGHYMAGDVLRQSVIWAIALVLGIAIAVSIADRIGFRRDDDPLSRLPLVGAVFALVALVLLPFYNAYNRATEARADRYALALTVDKAAAVREFVRLSDETLSPLCPTRLTRLYFLSFPPLGTRIAAVLDRPDPCP